MACWIALTVLGFTFGFITGGIYRGDLSGRWSVALLAIYVLRGCLY